MLPLHAVNLYKEEKLLLCFEEIKPKCEDKFC